MDKEKTHIEDFIFDPELNQIAADNDGNKLNHFKALYPGREEEVTQAFILLQNLKITPVIVPQQQIEDDLKALLEKVGKRKKTRIPLWISMAVAACACLFFALSTLIDLWQPEGLDSKLSMQILLDSTKITVEEVQIISGSTQAMVANNEIINQTDEGDLLVGEEEKVKSTDIQTEFVQLVVPYGRRSSIQFHDGTTAWLNAGSKLVYPKVFASDKREIFIEGEIYIDVKKQDGKPFIVHAKKFDIEVLGTRFNVNAYSEDAENSVVLVEGSVEVKMEGNTRKLSPNQGFFCQNGIGQIKQVDTYNYTCWKDGIMKIEWESLHNIFRRLARHYNVKIETDSLSLLTDKYRGKLNLDDSLEEVLFNLSTAAPFSYKRTDEDIMKVYMNK